MCRYPTASTAQSADLHGGLGSCLSRALCQSVGWVHASQLTGFGFQFTRCFEHQRDQFRVSIRRHQSICSSNSQHHVPAASETVAAYLACLAASHSRAALARRLPAIGAAHRLKELPWAVEVRVRHTLRGIHRRHGVPAGRRRP